MMKRGATVSFRRISAPRKRASAAGIQEKPVGGEAVHAPGRQLWTDEGPKGSCGGAKDTRQQERPFAGFCEGSHGKSCASGDGGFGGLLRGVVKTPSTKTMKKQRVFTGKGKIARLPARIREEVNRRLENGERAADIVAWLNQEPVVRERMAEYFNGAPVSEQNVSWWRQGGFEDWKRRKNAFVTEPAEVPQGRRDPRAGRPRPMKAWEVEQRSFIEEYRQESFVVRPEEIYGSIGRRFDFRVGDSPGRRRCALLAYICDELETLREKISLTAACRLLAEKYSTVAIGNSEGSLAPVSRCSIWRAYRRWQGARRKGPEIFGYAKMTGRPRKRKEEHAA